MKEAEGNSVRCLENPRHPEFSGPQTRPNPAGSRNGKHQDQPDPYSERAQNALTLAEKAYLRDYRHRPKRTDDGLSVAKAIHLDGKESIVRRVARGH